MSLDRGNAVFVNTFPRCHENRENSQNLYPALSCGMNFLCATRPMISSPERRFAPAKKSAQIIFRQYPQDLSEASIRVVGLTLLLIFGSIAEFVGT
jgi:hypothetical protein